MRILRTRVVVIILALVTALIPLAGSPAAADVASMSVTDGVDAIQSADVQHVSVTDDVRRGRVLSITPYAPLATTAPGLRPGARLGVPDVATDRAPPGSAEIGLLRI